MSSSLSNNKFVVSTIIIGIILAGMTIGNLPGPVTPTGIQVVDGEIFNFAEYSALNKEQLGIFNFLEGMVSHQPYGSWDGWYADGFEWFLHYFLAFIMYSSSQMFETTPGYRTDYYQNFSYNLIQKMNTSEAEWGEHSIEYTEWSKGFLEYYYDQDDLTNASNPDSVYTGGYRGPANIMWTGHYALMEMLYERSFNTGEMYNELTWFVEDWENSLTTDGLGTSKEGGIWGIGLIPCEPFIAFVHCNSIPIFATYLYDNLYGTNYRGIWDYGLNFCNTVLKGENGLFTDAYYVQQTRGYQPIDEGVPQTFPGVSIDRSGDARVSGYGTAWALTFLEYVQPQESVNDYPLYLEVYGHDVSGDKFYVSEDYHSPQSFGIFDILANLFCMPLTNQRGDDATNQRLQNFLYRTYNKVWSADGRNMHYDALSLLPFYQAPLTTAWMWGTTPTTLRDLGDARSADFWDYPYISEADDTNIWVFQAEWDQDKEAFILNIEVDQTATLVFSNFASTPTAYSSGLSLGQLVANGGDYTLTLESGIYQLVIM